MNWTNKVLPELTGRLSQPQAGLTSLMQLADLTEQRAVLDPGKSVGVLPLPLSSVGPGFHAEYREKRDADPGNGVDVSLNISNGPFL